MLLPELGPAGDSSLCAVYYYPTDTAENCGEAYPTVAEPLAADDDLSTESERAQDPSAWMHGLIYSLVTGPNVSAVRITGVGTVPAVSEPELPAGDRAVVFRARHLGTVVRDGAPNPGTAESIITPLDRAGQPIPAGRIAIVHPSFRGQAWQEPQSPTAGLCTITTAPDSGIRAIAGTTVRSITPRPDSQGAALTTCAETTDALPGTANVPLRQLLVTPHVVTVAVLVNAQHPTGPAPALWNTQPVPGHAGMLNIAVPPGLSPSPSPSITARRVGNTWLLAQGATLPARIQALDATTVSNLP